jgi:hypothetical protein
MNKRLRCRGARPFHEFRHRQNIGELNRKVGRLEGSAADPDHLAHVAAILG